MMRNGLCLRCLERPAMGGWGFCEDCAADEAEARVMFADEEYELDRAEDAAIRYRTGECAP